jgi:REP-associated tyrosine transposase
MPQSFSSIHLHLIFSTKRRAALISDEIAPELYAYLAKVFLEMDSPALIIGGTEDHVHILCRFSRTVTVASLMEEVKKRSSKWIKTKGDALRDFQWQTGYGAFSVGQSALGDTRRYIAGQKEHHRRRTFQDEIRAFLAKHGLEPDEEHMWE